MSEGRFLVSEELAAEWMTEYVKHANLAGLFRGWAADSFGTDASPRILYVGKATSGSFNEADVHSIAFDGRHAFWALGRRIAAAAGCTDELSKCLAWSNISKLSKTGIAAEPRLLNDLASLAVRTLEHEISETDPELIAFVTGHFSNHVVNQIANAITDSDWVRSENQTANRISDVWWKQRTDGRWVLWMCHPQGASEDKLSYAAEKVVELRSEYCSEQYPQYFRL